MKIVMLTAVFATTYIGLCRSNQTKEELMEVIITQQTQQNYGEAINAFFELGKLVEIENVDLSDKERKMFYDCYHFRRLQLLKDLVDSNNYLNEDIVKKLTDLFRLTEKFFYGLHVKEYQENDQAVLLKVSADKSHFEVWYSMNSQNYGNHIRLLSVSITYRKALKRLRVFLDDADGTILDACLRYSVAQKEYDTIIQTPTSIPCDNANTGLTLGIKASTESNPDLVPLITFINTYCSPDSNDDPHSIIRKYAFKRKYN